jgi:6-phosphogluconate dehydrogenase
MTQSKNSVGIIGLGVMGANLARNFASRGFRVAAYDRNPEAGARLAQDHPEAKLDVATSPEQFVAGLDRPRRIVLLVNAGAPVDAVIDQLDPLLEADDVVVDAGNSLYSDTDRRSARSAERPWRFMGMGVSGGSAGALNGPSMMPGGDHEAWERMKLVLEASAAVGPAGPCVTHCGARSAGHFVKMVHNGIEYGDMQLICEGAQLLRHGLGMSDSETADTFGRYNQGPLASYLIEITEKIFRFEDPERPGHLLVDAVMDAAGQKGTGRWTVIAALELGVPIPTIAAAVDARSLSAQRSLRLRSDEQLGGGSRPRLEAIDARDIESALYAAKLASYAQGFHMLRVASAERSYGIQLPEIARIWTAGCIIRARMLDRVREAFSVEPEPELLVLAPFFAEQIRRAWPSWRKVVAAASSAGYPIPGLTASLGWLETLTTSRGTANLIQAQRDYFGSHTYERLDRPGEKVHTDWGGG